MGFLSSLLNTINSGVQNANDNAQSGYDRGNFNIKRMSDDELRRKLQNRKSLSMKGMGEYKAYLDEARRRGIIN